MFEDRFRTQAASERHRDAPFADERARYINFCAQRGSTPLTLASKCRELLWAARLMAGQGTPCLGKDEVHALAVRRSVGQKGDPARIQERFENIVRPWLRYLGWWKRPLALIPWGDCLATYSRWMRTERGLAESTITQWQGCARRFLILYASTGRSLAVLAPTDFDRYLAGLSRAGCSRRSIRNVVKALRSFVGFASDQGWCRRDLAKAIEGPRVYADESLPMGPSWSHVQRLIERVNTNRPRDIRARAILMLLAIYGLRVGEVVRLRLEDVDWEQELLHVSRVKRRKLQSYPLADSVGAAIARYLREVRPASARRELFLGLNAPHGPLSQGAVWHVVSAGLQALNVKTAHFGPHALRHACAGRLVAEGLSLKEIGDHLGHRGVSATRIYAKVNLASLREIAAFDLGGLR